MSFTVLSKRKIETIVVVFNSGVIQNVTLMTMALCLGRLNRKLSKKSVKRLNRILTGKSSKHNDVLSFEIHTLEFTKEEAKDFEFSYQDEVQFYPKRIRSIHLSKLKDGKPGQKEICCKISDNPDDYIIFTNL
jgi:hydroxymethylpyrimidine pyrophosphatase-like HAD family hydrolase